MITASIGPCTAGDGIRVCVCVCVCVCVITHVTPVFYILPLDRKRGDLSPKTFDRQWLRLLCTGTEHKLILWEL